MAASQSHYVQKLPRRGRKQAKDPLRFPVVAEATRTIALELLFSDARGKPVPVRVASVYAPCSWRTIEEFDTTLEQVSSLVDTTPKDTLLFIGGDFNAGIDIANAYRRKITGPFGSPNHTQRGQPFTDFLNVNSLTSAMTHFNAKGEKKSFDTFSWAGKEERDLRQIDHILVRKEDKKQVKSCKS